MARTPLMNRVQDAVAKFAAPLPEELTRQLRDEFPNFR